MKTIDPEKFQTSVHHGLTLLAQTFLPYATNVIEMSVEETVMSLMAAASYMVREYSDPVDGKPPAEFLHAVIDNIEQSGLDRINTRTLQ